MSLEHAQRCHPVPSVGSLPQAMGFQEARIRLLPQ